jgi:hypothetical protein
VYARRCKNGMNHGKQRGTQLTAKDVTEAPVHAVQILGHELLCGWRLGHIQGREALISVAAEYREAAVRAGVRRGERLAEGPHRRPCLHRAGRRSRLLHRHLILLGLRHEHDLRVDLVGVLLRLQNSPTKKNNKATESKSKQNKQTNR